MKSISNYIGGELVPPASGAYLDNVEPATGAVYSRVPSSDAADVERAVGAARAAFPSWARTPVAERARLLTAIADRLEARLTELSIAEATDSGKPAKLARSMDIPRAVQNLRFFAGAAVHWASEAHVTDYAALNYTLRRPRGVAGLISPWNLPLYLLTWKVGPALATGNTAVAKPSELTPMTAYLLSEICRDVGLPAGVLNIVHGLGQKAGAAIVAHDDVRTISFTGGTVTGAEIARVAGPALKKVTLELGGKNPTLIFADCDLEATIEAVVRSSFANQGQICLCGSRLLIERSIYEPFVQRFVERVRALVVGDPLEPVTDQGALVSLAHQQKVQRYVALAREEGGQVLCGGGVPRELPERVRGGFFVEPTVISGLSMSCRTNQEEIFGPVVTVTPFDDEAEAVALANQSTYGLAASLWTNDLRRAHRVAEAVACGTIWVNTWLLRDLRVPFGGMNKSGVGREGGDEALRFFTEPKNVCVALGG
jgi:aminomuconate-semialdehyde/2-hydroxymuconate-6-semialdehyde dehydrogenase